MFDSYQDRINIWNINDNNNKLELKIDLGSNYIFDMCLWSKDYLCVSNNIGFQIVNIEKNQNVKTLENFNGPYLRKIRKIYLAKEGHSMIGIDSNCFLCLWPINCEKKNIE